MKVTSYLYGLPEEGQLIEPSRHLNEKYKFISASSRECRRLPYGILLSQSYAWKSFTIYYYTFLVHRRATVRQKAEQPAVSIDYMLEGNGAMILQGSKLMPLREKTCRMRYHPKGETEFLLAPGTYQWLYAELSPAFLEDFAGGYPVIKDLLQHIHQATTRPQLLKPTLIGYESQQTIAQLLALDTHPAYTTLELRGLLEKLVRHYLIDAQMHISTPAADGIYYNELHQLRKEIRTAPNAHTHTIRHIASRLAISEKSLSRQYFTLFGITLEEEARSSLMQYALNQITTTTKSFDTISEELGYSDRRSFTRAIRRYTGKRPSDIRKEHRNQPGKDDTTAPEND